MRKLLIIILIAIAATVNGQVRGDSVTYLPDSVNTVSVTDINNTLKYLEDKVSKRDWDICREAYITLLRLTEEKRRKPAVKK